MVESKFCFCFSFFDVESTQSLKKSPVQTTQQRLRASPPSKHMHRSPSFYYKTSSHFSSAPTVTPIAASGHTQSLSIIESSLFPFRNSTQRKTSLFSFFRKFCFASLQLSLRYAIVSRACELLLTITSSSPRFDSGSFSKIHIFI